MLLPSFDLVLDAARRIRPHVHRTPVLTCSAIDERVGAELFFKCENFQKAGVFKARGATNAVLSLSEEEAARGVATHSSGNHAAALALAAGMRGIKAHVVMPRTASRIKQEAVAGYGAAITFCEPTLAAREEALRGVVEETGAVFIHPYDDCRVIAGQGTAALELLEEAPDLGAVMTPVGGGGLLSGTAIAVCGLKPGTRVVAGEPAGADDACQSFRTGRLIPSVNPRTMADGLLTSLSERTFRIIREHVSDILTAPEEAIEDAMRLLFERMKIVVEASAAVPLATLLSHQGVLPEKRIGIVLSGGNVDPAGLPWIRGKA